MTTPAARKIPSLDGLRAISIALVLLGHLQGTRHFPALPLRRWIGDHAALGVTVFFVISGFLITSLLLEELERTGTVSLRLFYARRALRIVPAFLAFMAALGVAQALGWIHLELLDWVSALTYTVNYHVDRAWYIGHLWSLSVEEQFYLLWPWAVKKYGGRRSMWLAAGCFLLAPLVRAAMRIGLEGNPLRDLEIFPAVADGMAIGCLLAGARPWLHAQPWYRRLLASAVTPIAAVVLILTINRYLGWGAVSVLGTPVLLTAIAFGIDWSIHNANGRAGRLLNSSPLVAVGLLSYSLYVWQQPFLHRAGTTMFSAFPLNIVIVAVLATASYHTLEKPFMRLRHRLHRVRATPVPHTPPTSSPTGYQDPSDSRVVAVTESR